MTRIVTILGARPQFIKAAAISRCIKNKFNKQLSEIIVHTGQHYDQNMSEVFFKELSIPHPHYNLDVGSGSHATQTASMTTGIEEVLLKEKPDAVLVYGDTNSTLAGALAAVKIHIPVIHIEAGLRSYNKSMPEEINRIVCDHCSTLLFTPTTTGMNNLLKEGFRPNPLSPITIDNPKMVHTGDVMYDNAIFYLTEAQKNTDFLKDLYLEENSYLLVTIHRNDNTDSKVRLQAIFEAILEIANHTEKYCVIPLHPRTSKMMKALLPEQLNVMLAKHKHIKIVPPVTYFEMLLLESHAEIILTDSGGVQKEAYFLKKPCIIARDETEWVEIVEAGAGIVTGANKKRIVAAYNDLTEADSINFPDYFGDGNASEEICSEIIKLFNPTS